MTFLDVVLAVTAPASLFLITYVVQGRADRLDGQLIAIFSHRQAGSDLKPSRMTTVAQDLTALGGDTLRLIFACSTMIGLLADGRRSTAALLFASFVSARLCLLLLKRFIRRPRPDPLRHRVVTYTTSFPSGHTFMSAAVYLSAALLVPVGLPAAVQISAVAVALAVSLAIAVTRALLGVHWPLDVVAGFLLGIAWAAACALLGQALVR